MIAPLHSLLSPSDSMRWLNCPASIGYCMRLGLVKEGSVYADEGTAAHAIAAGRLLGKGTATDDPEMDAHVQAYVDFVRSKIEPDVTKLLVETRVPLFYYPEQQGTVDAALVEPGRIDIDDFKYGAGYGVYAKENTQLAIYAESLIESLERVEYISDDTLVNLTIFQPRDRNDPNPIRQWCISRADLREFCRPIEETAKTILRDPMSDSLTFRADPDKQCKFCPAKGRCGTYADFNLQGIEVLENEPIGRAPMLPDPNSLSLEQRTRIFAAKKAFIEWLEAIEDGLLADLLAGKPVPGYKLVEGKSNRQWTDEAAAKKLLSNYLAAAEITPPGDIVSPAAADKLLKAHEVSTKFENKLAALIVKPAGKPTLVPESDKRPALVLNALEGIEDLDAVKGWELV